MKIVTNKNIQLDLDKKVYECNVCKNPFNWQEGSAWFGSLLQAEEKPHELIFVCGDDCRKEQEKETPYPDRTTKDEE